MTCLDCKWYKTVKEMFSSNLKSMNLDIECSKKLPTFNKAMAHLWAYAYLLPWFKISETIEVGSLTHKTCERIYSPFWFFGQWCWSCFVSDEQCGCCQDGYNQINMVFKESVPYIGSWQYTQRCPLSNHIEYKLPNWTTWAYFTYYRYFDALKDMDSVVKIPDYLEPALDMLVAYHSANTDPADKIILGEDFINYMKQQYEVFKLSKQVPMRILPKLFT